MGDISAHFDTSEFRDHYSGALKGPSTRLIAVLENIRGQTGNRPLRIVSGYRDENHPETKKRPGSRHPRGDAADIPSGVVRPQQALDAGAIGVGVRDGWVVHVDTRPGRPVVFDD